ncbi:D-alanine--D-alanine ligase family protein [Thalassorhabdus alkalitolerans]|uniref:D-alanine--D-alanine ligase n=1 Tax=Thalassorhabdus alkalitolerans TaxID=2282697 RepID=A0ABW0YML6_9BACI
MNIAVLYGGKSPEHQVSLKSAVSVFDNIDYSKYQVTPIYITQDGSWFSKEKVTETMTSTNELITSNLPFSFDNLSKFDVIFPVLLGSNGEDGTLQGLFEIIDVPYVGNGVTSSAICMDKIIMKSVFSSYKIPQVNYLWWNKSDWIEKKEKIFKEIESLLGFPCYVKASNLGSSIGVYKCRSIKELSFSMSQAFNFSNKVIVEEAVKAREIELAGIGNNDIKFSVAGEVDIGSNIFYDYHAKYNQGLNTIVPANISNETYINLIKLAKKCINAVPIEGLFRADFFLTEKGKIYVNEINTFPGFTNTSMFPLLWEKTGLSYTDLIDSLIAFAVERHRRKKGFIKQGNYS